MAVRHGYGKIAGTDALVFVYDTGDTINSYKGEPTVNLASNANFSNGTTGWNANQNVTLSVETINNIRFLKVKSNQTTSTPGFKSGNIAVSGNTTYTLTIRAYKNDNRSIWLYATGNGTGGSDIVWTPAPNGPNPITTELTTISRTFTTPSDMTYLQIGALWSAPLTTSEVYVEYMQLEQKSHATPFINGTRSATQGLLDLTGRRTVDLSNVSFDSSAQMIFDGTDDQFTLNDPNTGTTFSMEFIVKTNEYISSPILISPNSLGYDHFVRINNSGKVFARFVEVANSSTDSYVGTTTLTLGKFYHITVTKSPTNGTIYVNGVAEDSHTPSLPSAAWSGAWKIGARYNSTFWLNGELPVIKIYNRALTSAEAQNNYRHYKTRFNI